MPVLLQINSTLNCGSTGRISEQIASTAFEHGWTCYMAHGGRYVGKTRFNAIPVSSRFDNYIHAFYGEYLGRHGLGSYFATKKFIRHIEKIKPDIIHLHNIHGYYLNYKVLLEYLSTVNIPIVWTLHDCWTFTGHCTHFDNVGCDKWKTGCESCPQLMAQYKSRLFDKTAYNYMQKRNLYKNLTNVTLVPVSCWLSQFIPDSVLSQFNVKVIQNGIDLNVFKPTPNKIREKFNIPTNKTIVLGVLGSGFGLEKGKKEFLELAKYDDIQIILLGLTNKDSKGIPDNVIKLGRTSSQIELAEFYSAADIFLNPTYNDTFPTTNIEAMACGTPSVAYRTGGCSEIIDESTGILVTKGDFDGLLRAIKIVRNNGKAHYSNACRERAAANFNKDDRFLDYINLYDELLRKG